MLVVACSAGKTIGQPLSKHLSADYAELYVEQFPDGEVKLRFPTDLTDKNVVLVQSLAVKPNDYLVELLIAIRTAKELGARKVVVVAPYLCYARQDIRFNPGEAISNRIVANLIQHAGADGFCTVSTHLHRIPSLSSIFSIPAVDVVPGKALANWIKAKIGGGHEVVLVGPDEESLRVVQAPAEILRCSYDTFKKQRFSSTKVKDVEMAHVNVKGKTVVLIDDIVSTGNTIIVAAGHLKKLGAKSVHCACVHSMSEQVGKKLLKKGIKSFASSNTIPTKYSKIDVSAELAIAVKKII